jgi:hypothetical protein
VVRDNVNNWPLYIALGLLVAGLTAFAWFAHKPILFVLTVPLIGWLAARVIVHGVGHFVRTAEAKSLEEWHGRFYGYGLRQLRAVEHEGELWFYEADLLAVCGLSGDNLTRLYPGADRLAMEENAEYALSESGCERLLLKVQHPEARRLLLFLQREAYFPHRKRKEKAAST